MRSLPLLLISALALASTPTLAQSHAGHGHGHDAAVATDPAAAPVDGAGAVQNFGDLRIEGAYLRATPPGAKVGAGYLSITNSGLQDAGLRAASSPVAGRVEIHTMAMENGVMIMRPLDQLVVAPGATESLKPGGNHLMLMDLQGPLIAGSTVPVTLDFGPRGLVTLPLPVRPVGQ